ncbi:MAG: FCD domain-containing protein [Paracoccaceae bacterium]|nr:FCD domain-containing protein [Paracoccaceae bacterium]MDE2912426.1 FCD domain-containing protein [Paracoccaceae bacterium]
MLTRVDTTEREEALAALRSFIAAERLNPGDRLPPERALMVSLGTTRTKLRQALDVLEREGTIWRHVGKGTFLAAEGFSRPVELARQVAPIQMMRARLAFEPVLAREAAIGASDNAIARIRTCRDNARSAITWETYEAHDDVFHRTIAETTGNILLLSLFDRLNQVRRAVAWNTVVRRLPGPPPDHPSFAEHDQIVTAIELRDPGFASAAMRDHLRSVTGRLFGDM